MENHLKECAAGGRGPRLAASDIKPYPGRKPDNFSPKKMALVNNAECTNNMGVRACP
jgi:hypothetical protein